jgi:hypothetical protein
MHYQTRFSTRRAPVPRNPGNLERPRTGTPKATDDPDRSGCADRALALTAPGRGAPPRAPRIRDRRCPAANRSQRVRAPTAQSSLRPRAPWHSHSRHCRYERMAGPRPLRQPGHHRTPPPALPARPHARTQVGTPGCTPNPTAHISPDHTAGQARPWPSVESRRCAPTVLTARTPVRHASVRIELGPRMGAQMPRDGPGGSGHADRPAQLLTLTCRFRLPAALSSPGPGSGGPALAGLDGEQSVGVFGCA